jgi:DNA-binding LacI/PurR family transcriptional regulator
MTSQDNQGRQTEKAKQALLRYIWENKLTKGALLPSQKELRENLSVGGATVGRAVRSLVDEGILDSRKGVGVFLKDAKPFGRPGISIGLAGLYANRFTIMQATLAQSVEAQLHRNGCRCVPFPHHEVSPDFCQERPLSSLPGLKETLQRGELAGLITLSLLDRAESEQLERDGVKVCYVGSLLNAPCGVMIDTPWFIGEGLRHLLRSGVKNPRIYIGPLEESMEHDLLEVIGRVLGDFGRNCSGNSLIETDYNNFLSMDFRQYARELMELPPSQRPDGLVLCDDIMAMNFTAELVRMQGRQIEYMPKVVSMQNREFRISLPIEDLTVYWTDLSQMAQTATELLLHRLSCRESPGERIRYRPQKEVGE